ncbi:glycosyltransferase [Pseudomonas sp. NW5]|uniref:glycosyltransferase n=1 Tax=Pseudomonas sp. NW5 TaxID=2934934 RepID=UPI002021CD06|nr:glycosyltransferase [Pseudomonas sp. NW5]MCL7462504.1 hypothetical protein [Pseudomonas sp. NW5]
MSTTPACSVIIPCYRDEAPLARLLAQLHTLAERCAQPLQIIVVDAARSAQCQALCHAQGAEWLPAEPCRGQQLRAGAAAAQHERLWFLHADAELYGAPFAALQAALAQGAPGGYFAFRLSGPLPWQARWLVRLTNWRVRLPLGVPYGDQGLFATREAYWAAGGHAPWPLFEEVPLVRGLRRQGALACVSEGLRVDPRRWQRDGWWRRALLHRLLALGFLCGVPVRHLARWQQRSRARDR